MQTIYEGGAIPSLPNGSVVTIGTFDGVHLGHQALLQQTRELARELHCPSVVVTFDRHPATVVRPESAPHVLTSLHHKIELLGREGVDHVHVLRFDEDRSLEPADEFVREVVLGTWHAQIAVAGDDFHYGHRRQGDVHALTDLGARLGFKVRSIGRVEDEQTGEAISSEAIREALAHSDVETAARLLGRPHEVQGIVEHGDHRGRTIGFPTANVAVPGDIQLPGDGVYTGWYERPDGARHPAAISVGRRPTFYAENGLLLVEAHLLDFDDDLYGERPRVQFTHWLRSQTRFGSVEDLTAQLGRDVDATRKILLG